MVATSSLGSVVTIAKVSRRVPSDRFHESQMPAKAKGPGSVRVMAKTRLMGLDAFFFLAGFGAVPKRSPGPASSIGVSGSYVGEMACPGFGHSSQPLAGTRQRRLGKGSRHILLLGKFSLL